jgi:hypothetical protein
MAVQDLAPALLSLGELFTEASVLLYPDRKPVALNIKATGEGSFLVHLLDAEGTWEQLVGLFSAETVTALINLRDLLGDGEVLALIRLLRGRTIVSQARSAMAGAVVLALDDHTTLEVPSELLTLDQSLTIRKKAQQIVAPLTKTGVDVLYFKNEAEVTLSIHKADVVRTNCRARKKCRFWIKATCSVGTDGSSVWTAARPNTVCERCGHEKHLPPPPDILTGRGSDDTG